MDNFDFIADQKFRALLIRDFKELQNCVENKATKSVLILSGSIIETILLEFFSHNLPNGKSKAQLLKMNLADLINQAELIGLISSKSKELSTVIKNYRNLIHPGREIRTKEEFDFETAIVSFSLVKIILKEVKENYIQKYGYKAEDIFNKIIVDTSTFSIYEKLLQKLNNYEKIRLTSLLVDYQIEKYDDSIRSEYLKYISPLKALIGQEDLRSFCEMLLREVEKGKENQILALYEIFGNNLDLLPNEEKELILTYIYNILDDIHPWSKKLESLKFRELYSYLGLYLNSNDLKQMFFDLLTTIVRKHNTAEKIKWCYLSIYRNMISNFSDEKKIKCEEYIRQNCQSEIANEFYVSLINDDDLPF